MRIINNPDAIERASIGTEINRLAVALIGYLFITSMVSLIIIFITGEDINGVVYLVSSPVGFGFIWFIYRRDFRFYDIVADTRDIPPKVLFNSFVVVLGIQPVFQLLEQGITNLFFKFNYEITYPGFDQHDGGSIFILINLVVVGPLVEELIFRGVLLRSLSQYGRNFAMVTTSILFGLYHASLIQNGYSFVVGLVLAYIALRYSIKWSIILHCANNMVMIIIAYLSLPYMINYLFLGIFFLGGIIILLVKRKKIAKFISKGKSKKNAYKYTFSNIYLLSYIGLTLLLTLMSVSIVSLYA